MTCSKVYFIFGLFYSTSVALQCRDSNDKPVDWFVVYKLPKLPHNSSNYILRYGLGYFYMDINSPHWNLSKTSIGKQNHAIFYTLNQIYDSKPSDDILYLMYNDENPENIYSLHGGHTKGVVSFDKNSGFWLVHSTPKFPPMKKYGYDWPESAKEYGQQFLCVSYDYKMLNTIGLQLIYNHPHFYDISNITDYIRDNPNIGYAVQGVKLKKPPWTSKVELVSLNGTKFLSFAKDSKFHKDLYEDFVAPTLKGSLFVESWRSNDPEGLPSNCSQKYKVYNTKLITLPNGIRFKETKDHAKWVVSQNATYWLCVGDINRQYSQLKRAGGTVCFENKNAWQAFNNSVGAIAEC